jgi:hypothetical protein
MQKISLFLLCAIGFTQQGLALDTLSKKTATIQSKSNKSKSAKSKDADMSYVYYITSGEFGFSEKTGTITSTNNYKMTDKK